MKKTPVTIILPDIRSAMNIGAIFRTAEAIGTEEIILTGYSATPEHPKVAKTAIGANVPWHYESNIFKVISSFKKKGYQIVSLEKTESSDDIFSSAFHFPVALIVGNEISGVDKEVLDLSDLVIHLPMLGKKESLNVATATGVALYKILENYRLASRE
jgi:23S rRNA (guanosine2251-2'-O)-methyltransferase